jgi:hypothetical protein
MNDKKTRELLEKCESMKDDPDLMNDCKMMLKVLAERKVIIKEDPEQNYTNMVENISADDIPKVLEMALKIARSNEIKDPDIKNAAEKLIRTIEPL